jgi:hypothetical protein
MGCCHVDAAARVQWEDASADTLGIEMFAVPFCLDWSWSSAWLEMINVDMHRGTEFNAGLSKGHETVVLIAAEKSRGKIVATETENDRRQPPTRSPSLDVGLPDGPAIFNFANRLHAHCYKVTILSC